ncbi:L,D-transpeptidase family protein [Stappia sp.]|uniref:L,D-transpeptidase family protein n=1 Tax=Stappia sp. TaxID=1870903 RepID=UPI0025E6C9FD|nr:L,D-transpeptidase family protein [Stappia sp.]
MVPALLAARARLAAARFARAPLPCGGETPCVVRASGARATKGRLSVGAITLACALGRSGMTRSKREGDGKTVTGVFPVLFGFYRPDRMVRPRTRLPMVPLSPELGWCDAPGHAAYNRPVALPFDASHERMWRDDGLYDVVLVPDVNVLAPVAGRGSALFIHIARPGYTPTEGCIAVSRRDMGLLLDRIGPETPLVVSV